MIWALLGLLGCILIFLLVAKRRQPTSVVEAEEESSHRDEREEWNDFHSDGVSQDPIKDRKGPPDLSKLKAAYQGLSIEALENILEMGVRLKPGAEEFLRAELRRRQKDDRRR